MKIHFCLFVWLLCPKQQKTRPIEKYDDEYDDDEYEDDEYEDDDNRSFISIFPPTGMNWSWALNWDMATLGRSVQIL